MMSPASRKKLWWKDDPVSPERKDPDEDFFLDVIGV